MNCFRPPLRARWLRSWLLLASGLLLKSCTVVSRNSTPTFVPLSAYVPMLPRAGAEGSLTVGALGTEGQVALAPTANVVVLAQGQQYRADKRRDRFRSGEVGFGIVPWRTANLMVGLFAGAGAGRGSSKGWRYETSNWFNSSRYDSSDRSASAAYRTYYLMPAVGYYEPDEHLELAIAAKFYRLDYQRIDYTERLRRGSGRNDMVREEFATTTRTSISDAQRTHVQIIGHVGLGLGVVPRLMAHLQIGGDFDLRRQNRFYQYEPFVLAVGLRYRLGRQPPAVTQ